MKIRLLVPDPIEEFGDFGVRAERGRIRTGLLELAVGEDGVEGAVTDGVDRRGFAAAAAPGDDVVPLDAAAERAAAQEAGYFSIHWRRMNQARTATAIRTQTATTPQKASGACA